MLKLFRWCSTLAMLSVGSLLATNHPCPGSWGASIDFVFLKPSVDDTSFVIKGPATVTLPSGTKRNNDLGFKPGFRLGGVYALCDCNQEFQVYYTRLSVGQSKRVSGDRLWGPLGINTIGSNLDPFEGTAQSDAHSLYQRVEANFAQQTFDYCGLDVYLQLGFEFASFNFRQSDTYAITAGPTIDHRQKSKTWGIGPQVGLAVEYDLCDCSEYLPGKWSLTGLASGSLLVSESKLRNQQGVALTHLTTVDDPAWRFVPAVHARIGVNYGTTIQCHETNFEVGYEFNSYFRGLARSGFPNSGTTGLNPVGFYNYDLQGLYISGSMQF